MDERIRLEHGGGGTAMMRLLMETVLKDFELKRAGRVGLDEMDDGATVDIGDKTLVFTTDSHTVKPIFFPGGDIGRLAVSGTVNDLAVMGGRPLAIASAVVVEEGFRIDDFRKICKSMNETAKEVGVPIVTGDFKVMEKGSLDGIVITTTGVGIADSVKTDSMLKPGQMIILSGTVGDHGATILAERNNFEFEDLRSDVAPVWDVVEAALAVGGISAMKDPTRGGLASALNEMASKSGVGIVIWEEEIPVKEPVRALCETLGIDFLTLTNEGKVLIGVDRDRAEEVLAAVRKTLHGKEAKIIGEVVGEHPGRVLVRTTVGGHRILNAPVGDPIPRIC
ncbi:MAG: hydrogenase expression/formation protein HypE [Candidatus Hadarchaeales archaeon]